MKLWKVAVAAMFALFMFAMPGRASAEWYPRPVPAPAPVARYYPARYYPAPHYYPAWSYGRPWACRDPWFRRHHRVCW